MKESVKIKKAEKPKKKVELSEDELNFLNLMGKIISNHIIKKVNQS